MHAIKQVTALRRNLINTYFNIVTNSNVNGIQ
jgi:hypothetical protein